MRCEQTEAIRKMMEHKIGRPLTKGEEVHYLIPVPANDGHVQLMRTPYMHRLHHLRPSLEEIFMGLAERLALRTNCGRAAHGCVIVSKDMTRILGIGYNGQGKGLPHSMCKAQTQGGCTCLHAEINAIAKLSSNERDKVFFITGPPCEQCANAIINSGASKVVIRGEHYRPVTGPDRLKNIGISIVRLE